MKTRYNRRQFLSVSGVSGVSLVILLRSQSARGYHANEKLNLAILGAGGRGAQNLTELSQRKHRCLV